MSADLMALLKPAGLHRVHGSVIELDGERS